MKTVWIVYRDFNERRTSSPSDEHVIAVFSQEEKALDYAENWHCCYVEAWLLDDPDKEGVYVARRSGELEL